MARIRHGESQAITATGTAWRRLLNVPPSAAEGQRGHVVVSVENAVIQVRATVTVEQTDDAHVYLAGPGEPAVIPVDRYGVDLDYRAVLLTTYEHDEYGVPTWSANPAPRATVRAQYRPDGEPFGSRPPRVVSLREDVLGQLFANQRATLRMPLGPPGIWRLERVSVTRPTLGSGGTPASLFDSVSGALNTTLTPDYLDRQPTDRNATESIVLPSESAAFGGPMGARQGYSPTGLGVITVRLDAGPHPDSVFRVCATWRFLGLTLPASGTVL